MPPPARLSRSRGATLVEMMIAMLIGLVIVIAMSALFVGSSASRREVQASAEASENGRYALDLLSRELSVTGFYGALVAPPFALQAGLSKGQYVCPESTAAVNLARWTATIGMNVTGFNSANDPVPHPTDANPACFSRKAGTDAIFIQRVSTCFVGEANCGAENPTYAYLQVSECGDQYFSSPFELKEGAATFSRQTKACDSTILAPKRKFVRRVYYVGDDDALSYIELGYPGGPPSPPDRTILVENVEQMQIEYAIDANNDGTADCFTSTPDDPVAVSNDHCPASFVTDQRAWQYVIGARIYIVARSTDSSRNTSNQATYLLNDFTYPISASSSAVKRRVYQSFVPFTAPKMRRES